MVDFFTTILFIFKSLVLTGAHGYRDQASTSTIPHATDGPSSINFAYLSKPLHTTALVAGEAWRLTREAEEARTRSADSRGTDTSEADERLEL